MLKKKTKRYREIKEYYWRKESFIFRFFFKGIMIKFYDVYESMMMSMKTTTKMMMTMIINKKENMAKGVWRLSTQVIDENDVLSNTKEETHWIQLLLLLFQFFLSCNTGKRWETKEKQTDIRINENTKGQTDGRTDNGLYKWQTKERLIKRVCI